MTIGVTVGKFYLYHKGHDYMITEAKKRVDKLYVILGYTPDQDFSGSLRANWIRQMHPDVEVRLGLENIPEESKPWAEFTLRLLGEDKPDYAFTSENYGEEWAGHMDCIHIPVDRNREKFPISGTMIRSDIYKYWDMLTPPVKAYFAKRVCCVGVESSGTTTLAQKLAEHYNTAWVPEYGRWYWEGRRYTPKAESWSTHEFAKIARGQQQWEKDLAWNANKLMICDTDALATHVWHKRYMGYYSEMIEKISDKNHYDLYILTNPDFGFIQDGTREGEYIRKDMHQWFISELSRKNKKFITVTGSHENRMAQATKVIDSEVMTPLTLDLY